MEQEKLTEVALAGYGVQELEIYSTMLVRGLAFVLAASAHKQHQYEIDMGDGVALSAYEQGEYRCLADFACRHKSPHFIGSTHMDQGDIGFAIDKDGVIS